MRTTVNLAPTCVSALLICTILVLVLFPGQARAAVTNNGTPTFSQVIGTSLSWAHTVDNGVNRALFVEIATANTGYALSVTYGGVPLSPVFRRTSGRVAEIWVLVAPPVGTANVDITFSEVTGAICGATTFNGVKQSAPTGDFATASGLSILGLGASVTVSSAPGDMVIDVQNWDSLLTLGIGAGQTELWWHSAVLMVDLNAGSTEQAGAASVTMSGGISLNILPYVMGAVSITASPPMQISGTVFEDVNYGGGAGRDRAASGGVARSGARVELFNGSGNYVNFTTTDGAGAYSFSGLTTGTYTVRVVNSSVTSSRPGSVAGLLPVQTYRTDATSGAPASVTDRVGGEAPEKVDAGNGATTLAALTTVTTAPQSVTTVTLTETDVIGLDFGFNFDAVVNRNDTGQGSLRQFILNADTLGNAGLAQVGQSAGNEAAIFMIPDGSAHPGLRAGIVNQLTGGVAVIQLATVLPPISDNNTIIDGTLQATNVGNTNPGGLEVEISGNGVTGSGLLVSNVFGVTIRGMAIHGFAGTVTNGNGIYVLTATSTSIYGCYLGTNASGAAAAANNAAGVAVGGASSGTAIGGLGTGEGNLIALNSGSGVNLDSFGTGTTIRGNTIRGNGQGGVYSAATGILIAKNLIHNNGGAYDGIWLDSGSSNAKVYQNTVHGNGRDGIRVGDIGATIKNNIFTGNGGYGINRVAASMTEAYNDVTDAATTPANAAGRSNVALDTSDLNVNPLYVNAAAFNFSLTECTSPAINQGTDLGADQPDMNGASPGLWNNNAPEQGALETIGNCAPSLSITKQAWELGGAGPYSSITAPVGSSIAFLIYVKNTTAGQVTDLRMNDLLDESAFQYVSGSMVRTSAATPPSDSASDLAIFNATAGGTGTAVSDGVDGDVASALNTGGLPDMDRITIGAVAGQANAVLTLGAHSTFGVRFTVKIR